jgi:LysR family glycine cleavage system transcriptional activator
MARRPYDLPSPVALQAFEAAARHLSLKAAAAELNVTPGAVSRQVKALETDLGVELFTRVHRGVELTQAGEDLFSVLAWGFDQTAQVVRRLRQAGAESAVTIGSSTAFGQLWLMPRMGGFWQSHPDVTVNHVLSDVDRDLVRAGVDVRTLYRASGEDAPGSMRLFGDTMLPVASPAFVERHAGARAADLVGLPLLRVEGLDPDWITWEGWFDRLGIPHGRLQGRTFNNYAITLQAARDDQGVALGWRSLVEPMLRSGELTAFTDAEVEAGGAFFVAWPADRPLSEPARLLRDWIVEAARVP